MLTGVSFPVRSFSALLLGLLVGTSSSAFAQGSDDCATPEPISGVGLFDFDTVVASTGTVGQNNACLGSDPTILEDVWFVWSSPFDGLAEIGTCGLDSGRIRIVVYDGADCPTATTQPLACGDFSGLGCNGTTASVNVTAGSSYLIQIGNTPDSLDFAAGRFFITRGDAPTSCTEPASHCQPPGGGSFVSPITPLADDFTPATDGQVSGLCWYGMHDTETPPPEEFEIRYYQSSTPFPDLSSPLAVFRQGVDLDVSARAPTGNVIFGRPEFEYTATHPPVAVQAGSCYFVEVREVSDTPGDTWSWTTSAQGNGFSLSDSPLTGTPGQFDPTDVRSENLAFCLSVELATPTCIPPPPENDDCTNPTPIEGTGTFAFDNTSATAGAEGQFFTECDALDSTEIGHDVWYCWTSDFTGPCEIDTCGQTSVDTKIAVYDGCSCPTEFPPPLACNEDASARCSPFQSRLRFSAIQGQQYMLQVGTFPLAPAGGSGTFTVLSLEPCPIQVPPGAIEENETCGEEIDAGCNATPVGHFISIAPGEAVHGTTWADAGRDTDFYEIAIGTTSHLAVRLTSEIPMAALIRRSGCDGAVDPDLAVYSSACQPGEVTADVSPGDLISVVPGEPGVGYFNDFPCDPLDPFEYVLQLHASCQADLDADADVDVFDLLAYLELWFASDPSAERTGDQPPAVDVFDLLVYLDGWFVGCN